MALAKLVFGHDGERAYMAYVDGDHRAFKGMSDFEILSDETNWEDEESEGDDA